MLPRGRDGCAFGRDLLSPLLNLGWFVGCLVACWCIGRPYRVAPWSLALAAIALSVPALADQAGEARNDIVGIFFLLAAVAVALNAWRRPRGGGGARRLSTGALVGRRPRGGPGGRDQAQLPAAGGGARPRPGRVAPPGRQLAGPGGDLAWPRSPAAATGTCATSSTPATRCPGSQHLGPITLPAPEQALGGREAHSVLGYLTDGSVWSDWFLPGLHHGLWRLALWPAASGRSLALARPALAQPRAGRARSRCCALAGLVGLAAAPRLARRPDLGLRPRRQPRGFESGLRYLAPALVLGLALLPAAPCVRDRLARLFGEFLARRG